MRTPIRALWLVLMFVVWGASSPAHSSPPASPGQLAAGVTPTVSPAASLPWDLPNQCETINRKVWSKERKRYYYKRERHDWSREDRKRVREVQRLVAAEMGADYRYLWVKSIIESSGNPESIHILNRDFEANKESHMSFTWSQNREDQLLTIMEQYGAQARVYWKAKAELHRRTTYKGNPYWAETETIPVNGPGKQHETEHASVWSWGYGLYGMNAVGFTTYWHKAAPPWVLCAQDGVVATVVAVWALRAARRSCVGQGDVDNWDTLNHRVSRGHCPEGEPSQGSKYVRWSKEFGLDRMSRPKLGKKWDESSDREVLFEHLVRRIEEECLTRDLYHRSACTDKAAKGYSRKPVDLLAATG